MSSERHELVRLDAGELAAHLADSGDVPAVTRAVNRRREAYDVYIGRPSVWGNPYVIGRDGTRAEVIEKYRTYVLSRPDLLARLPELRGKRLGCYCKPAACHGDVLAELATQRAEGAGR